MPRSPRVTTGVGKGKKLKVPKISDIRIAQDIVKGALFSILGEKTKNSVCLDLYAGSGSFGIEALSRGAASCDFVDKHKLAIEAIEENLENCIPNFKSKTNIYKEDAVKFASNAEAKYDIVFVDPFYGNISHKFLFKNLNEILNETGVIAFTHGGILDTKELIEGTDLSIHTERRFGKSYVTVFRKET